MDLPGFERAVRHGIETSGWELLEEWTLEHGSASFDFGAPPGSAPFLDLIFDYLLELLQRKDFLLARGSYRVLLLFESEWSLLTDCQKEQLLPALIVAYPRFRDWMSWFVISEILGRFFGDEPAFRALCFLKETVTAARPRSLVPMGLERIVKGASDNHLARKACSVLMAMRDDPAKSVRDEVETSLRRIAAQAPHRLEGEL
jgi:hypothetical protein